MASSYVPTASNRLSDRGDLVSGLEAIIDATAGILAAGSLEATLQAMADALAPIIPYTSLAVYEVDWAARECVPLLATGCYVEQTLAWRPPLDASTTGDAVLGGTLVCRTPTMMQYVMPGTSANDVETIVVAPLLAGGVVLGALDVWREESDPRFADDVSFAPDELTLLERFASLAAMAYANSFQREQLRTQALTDALTGLFNRRQCETALAATLADGLRHGEPTSIAYFDIDGFKSINDGFGHGAGDAVLQDFAGVLSSHSRAGDIICRTGGEEFTVVLPRTAAAPAEQVASRISDAVREARLGPRSNVTVSAGVATSPRSREDQEWLIRRADAALLHAKRSGRDRVVAAAP